MCQIDAAVLAKLWDRFARVGVQGDEIRIPCTNENALIHTVGPIGDSAVHEAEIGGRALFVGLRIIYLERLPGPGVNGRDLAQRGAGVQASIDHQRGRFIHHRPEFRVILEEGVLYRTPPPGNVKLLDVVLMDLVEWGILGVSNISPVAGPCSLTCLDVPSSATVGR